MNTLEKFKARLVKTIPTTEDGAQVYDDLKESVIRRLDDGRKVTVESIDEAINSAVASVSLSSSHTKEQVSRAAARLRRELEDVRDSATETGESMLSKAMPTRPRTRFLLATSAAMGVGSFLIGRLSARPRAIARFKKGETAGPGLYVCRNCDTRLQIASQSKMPECSNCHSDSFNQIR